MKTVWQYCFVRHRRPPQQPPPRGEEEERGLITCTCFKLRATDAASRKTTELERISIFWREDVTITGLPMP